MWVITSFTLWVMPMVLGIARSAARNHGTHELFKGGYKVEGHCIVRTVTYLATYDSLVSATGAYETASHGPAPHTEGYDTDDRDGSYPGSSHDGYPDPVDPCETFTTLRPVTLITTLTTTIAIPTTIVIDNTITIASVVTSTLTTVSTFTTSVLETLTYTATLTTTTSSIITTAVPSPFEMLSIRAAAMPEATPVRQKLPSSQKRQSDGGIGGFIGPLPNPNPKSCSDAVPVKFLGGQLIVGNRLISTDVGVSILDLAKPLPEDGAITTEFFIADGILRWANVEFFGGFARFCQLANGTVYALFSEIEMPTDCVSVDVVVYSSDQCANGTIIVTGPAPTGPTSVSSSAVSITVSFTTSSGSSSTTSSAPLQTFPIFAGDTGTIADGYQLQPGSQPPGTSGFPAIFGKSSSSATYSLDPVTGKVLVSADGDGILDGEICCTYHRDGILFNPAACSISACSLGGADVAPLQCAALVKGTLDCFLNVTSVDAIYRLPQIGPLADGSFQLYIGTTVLPGYSPVILATVGPTPIVSTTSSSHATSSTTATPSPQQTFPVFSSDTGGIADGFQLQPQTLGSANSPAVVGIGPSNFQFHVDPVTHELLGSSGSGSNDQQVCCRHALGGQTLDPAACVVSTCSPGDLSFAPLQCDSSDVGVTTLNCYLNATSAGNIFRELQLVPLGNDTFQLEIGSNLLSGSFPVTLSTVGVAISSSSTSSATGTSTVSSALTASTPPTPTGSSTSITSTTTTTSIGPLATFSIFATDSGTSADGGNLQPQSGAVGARVIFASTASPATYSIDPTTGELLVYSGNGNNGQNICCQYWSSGAQLDPAPCSMDMCSVASVDTAPLQCIPDGDFLDCYLDIPSISAIYTVPQLALLPDGTYQLEFGTIWGAGNSLVILITVSPVLPSSTGSPPSTTNSPAGGSSSTGPSSSTMMPIGPQPTFPIFASDSGTNADSLRLQPQSGTDSNSPAIFGSVASPVTYSLDPSTNNVLIASGDNTNKEVCCTYIDANGIPLDPAPCALSTCTLGDATAVPLQCTNVLGNVILDCYIDATSIGGIYTIPQLVELLDGTYQLEIGSQVGAVNSLVTLVTESPVIAISSSSAGPPTSTATLSSASSSPVITSLPTSDTSAGSSTTTITPPLQTFSLFAANSGTNADGTQLQPAVDLVPSDAILSSNPSTVSFGFDPVTGQLLVMSPNNGNQNVCCTYSNAVGQLDPAPCTIATCAIGDAISAPLQCTLAGTDGPFSCTLNAATIFATYFVVQLAPRADGSYQLEIGTTLGAGNIAVDLSTVPPVVMPLSSSSSSSSVPPTTSPSSTVTSAAPTTSQLGGTERSTILSSISSVESVTLPTNTISAAPTTSQLVTTETSSTILFSTNSMESTTLLSSISSIPPTILPISTITSAELTTSSLIPTETLSTILPSISSIESTTLLTSILTSTELTTSLLMPTETSSIILLSTSSIESTTLPTSILTSTELTTSLLILTETSSTILLSTSSIVSTILPTSILTSTELTTSLLILTETSSTILPSTSSVVPTISTAPVTETSTAIITLSPLVTTTFPTSTTTSSAPTSSVNFCSANNPAYYIVDRTLVREDLVFSLLNIVSAAVVVPIKTNVASDVINAMGFNVLDGFLYAALGAAPSRLIRISTIDGSYIDLGSLGLIAVAVAGVVDENSQYWLTDATNTRWTQVNLVPGSFTFGQVVASGTSAAPAHLISDWAWVPGTAGGNNLWSVSRGTGLLDQTTTYLMQWNRATKTWTTAGQYLLSLLLAQYQSVFANQDNALFAADSNTGTVYSFNLPGTGQSLVATPIVTLVGMGAIADGARGVCPT